MIIIRQSRRRRKKTKFEYELLIPKDLPGKAMKRNEIRERRGERCPNMIESRARMEINRRRTFARELSAIMDAFGHGEYFRIIGRIKNEKIGKRMG